MNNTMEELAELARAAQRANDKDWTIDDLFEAILESTRKSSVGMVYALDSALQVLSFDPDQIYKDFAEAIGKDSLTEVEKQQALLNHVLETGG